MLVILGTCFTILLTIAFYAYHISAPQPSPVSTSLCLCPSGTSILHPPFTPMVRFLLKSSSQLLLPLGICYSPNMFLSILSIIEIILSLPYSSVNTQYDFLQTVLGILATKRILCSGLQVGPSNSNT